MLIRDLNQVDADEQLEADLVIIGGGPAGLTIAREFFGDSRSVLVLESGRLQEEHRLGALNRVEGAADLWTDEQARRRADGHGSLSNSWSHAEQLYGVRCRVLGGSSHAWAGKSAAFDPIDLERRNWVPYSGWPITLSELDPYIERAVARLNLGPNINGDRLWDHIGIVAPGPSLDSDLLQTFFWQFARSKQNPFDAMRFGPDFASQTSANVRVLVNATVTQIVTSDDARVFRGVEVTPLDGQPRFIRGKIAVLAASGIENPRLLLSSNRIVQAGIGNENGSVGRYLMDHAATQIAYFGQAGAAAVVKRFGFQGVSHQGRMHMYMHGAALPPELQEREGLLNAAFFMLEQHAQDDPLIALKRLTKGDRASIFADLVTVLKSPATIIKGLGIKGLQSGKISERAQNLLVDTIIRVNPNFAVRETLHRGLQHKLLGVRVEGITEQCPDPENRITLSDSIDMFGVPLAKVSWRVDTLARKSLARLGTALSSECSRVGLPSPGVESWIVDDRFEDAPVIDMAHTMGTTRMSVDSRHGVVDANCRIHNLRGLFVAGGSVFPTGGHSNPTLMILAMAIRLADHLKHNAPDWR